jgi:hypothetical protein
MTSPPIRTPGFPREYSFPESFVPGKFRLGIGPLTGSWPAAIPDDGPKFLGAAEQGAAKPSPSGDPHGRLATGLGTPAEPPDTLSSSQTPPTPPTAAAACQPAGPDRKAHLPGTGPLSNF